MAQEEQHIVSSSHSGDSDRSRNVKEKKIPQRGLGGAQLEKIRVEEQRKKGALVAVNALANNAVGSVTDASPSPSPVNFRSSNTLYSSPSPSMNGGAEDGNSWCRSWNGDQNHRYNAAGFRPPVNFQSELNAAAALPVPQRFFLFQQPASPVVNPSSPSASHMEPPSNQNHLHCNSYVSPSSPWPEEYKMVGVKRSYPFSLESPPAHSFTHFDPPSFASESSYDELASCGSGYPAQMEPRNVYMSYSRDGPSPPEQDSRRVLRDDGRLNGDFLTLAPPAAALPPPNSKHAYAIDDLGSQGPEENERRQVHHLIASRSREETFSFFPVRSDESGGEKREAIDLNLKL